jgi:hypothetical protein
MSAYGEYFIGEDLAEASRALGLIKPNEELILPSGYYGIYDARDMKPDTISIRDRDNGDAKGKLSFTGVVRYDEDTGNYYDIKTLKRDDGDELDAVTGHKVGDWLIHLQPIIDNLKDGEPKLTSTDVDWLMDTLRAKVEFVEGLITEEEYTTILNDMER